MWNEDDLGPGYSKWKEEEDNKEMKDLIIEFSKLRDKIKEMSPDDKGKFKTDYIAEDFSKDIAMLSGICIKIYTYLGYKYLIDTVTGIIRTVETFEKLDKYSF